MTSGADEPDRDLVARRHGPAVSQDGGRHEVGSRQDGAGGADASGEETNDDASAGHARGPLGGAAGRLCNPSCQDLATECRTVQDTTPAAQAIILRFLVDNESENGYRSKESESLGNDTARQVAIVSSEVVSLRHPCGIDARA